MALGFLNALVDFSPIFFGRVGLISFKFIMLTTYLGSWALVALVIALTFLGKFSFILIGGDKGE